MIWEKLHQKAAVNEGACHHWVYPRRAVAHLLYIYIYIYASLPMFTGCISSLSSSSFLLSDQLSVCPLGAGRSAPQDSSLQPLLPDSCVRLWCHRLCVELRWIDLGKLTCLHASFFPFGPLSGSVFHPQPPSLLILLSQPGSERKVLTKES